MLTLANFVLFQAGWFACVLSSARGTLILPAAVVLISLTFNLIFHKPRKPEIKFLVSALALGTLFEFSIAQFHVLEYQPSEFFPPVWILSLWFLFATTFSFSMHWIVSRPLAGFALGALLGPLSCWSAETLGALTLTEEFWPRGYGILGIHWGAAILGLTLLYRYFHKQPV